MPITPATRAPYDGDRAGIVGYYDVKMRVNDDVALREAYGGRRERVMR